MWFLKHLENGTFYYIRPELSKHTVSRSVGDLIIQGDPSISRNHAFLYPEADALKVVDAGSRYGTFLNECIEQERDPIAKDKPTPLKVQDRIRFGKCQSLWVVQRASFNCITSTISVDGELKGALQKLGGRVLDSFQEKATNYLIMKTITTTPKLLMCLIAQVPVVKPEFFGACIQAIESGSELPNYEKFIPEFTEAYVRSDGISFKCVAARETLFKGKVFVFIKSKHMTQYEGIIKQAGGSCLCAQKRKIAKAFFTEPHVIVMQAISDSFSQTSSQAVDGLTQIVCNSGRRLIPDAEIGLAVLHCSLEKYCNPLYKFTNVLDLETIPFTQGPALAKDSEDLSKKTQAQLKENISIPETESRDCSQAIDVCDSPDKESVCTDVAFKMPEIVPVERTNTEGKRGKRKCTEPVTSPPDVKKTRSKIVDEPRQTSPTAEKVSSQSEVDEKASNQPLPSRASNSFGFMSVDREAAEQEERFQKSQKAKRPVNLMLDDGDDDLFNFEEALPKRAKRQPTLTESFSATQSQQTRKTRNVDKQSTDDDLFAFDGAPSRRTNRRGNLTSAEENAQSSSLVPNNDTEKLNAITTNATTADYKTFIKPVHIPADGWLSASFADLKVKSQADDNGDETIMHIKKEDPDCDEKTRVWIDGMESMFQVRVKCMSLVSHRPVPMNDSSFFSTRTNSNVSNGSKIGGNNFKAFVKFHFRVSSSRK
ncbi:nibrin isoform X2 [Uranotaenia lowii]|uniref:nibrin isoform X2 n=1 Tax=Uranotaenia lowii TaxID=190385 RepID=UPI002478B069|nr:nibrin isoform X2 [Uranotaenia lowii]